MTGDIQRSYRLQTPLARLFGCIRAHRNIAVATPLGGTRRGSRRSSHAPGHTVRYVRSATPSTVPVAVENTAHVVSR
jgi:hypothetical protein